MDPVVFDIECYVNYFLVKFKKIRTGKIIGFEYSEYSSIDFSILTRVLKNNTIISFNGYRYDMVMLLGVYAGLCNKELKKFSDFLIDEKPMPWEAAGKFGIKQRLPFDVDTIDLINVAPLVGSLKLYGGRLHSQLLQDLPIDNKKILTRSEMVQISKYCDNDLQLTENLYNFLKPEILLREDLSKYYDQDMRSKSDAQIAEAVFKTKCPDTGIKPSHDDFYYIPPSNIKFKSSALNSILDQYKTIPMKLDAAGHIEFDFRFEKSDKIKSGRNEGSYPARKKKIKANIGGKNYSLGVGGFHSCEKKQIYKSCKRMMILAPDVTSFYPRIIINNKLYPPALGPVFNGEYEHIVVRRLDAKVRGHRDADSLKIVINGGFGKLGSHYSCLYSPDLMAKVTITGQLTMLMLIEAMVKYEIEVISGNTDGLVLYFERSRYDLVKRIMENWEEKTGYNLESEPYSEIHSRDVNNYIALKENGKIVGKGAFADQSDLYYKLRKNPVNMICVDSVKEYLKTGKDIMDSIKGCKDITKFTTLRNVKGGAVCDDNPNIGKVVRWYYADDELDSIFYRSNGHKVPDSEGATPLMDLPDKFPNNVDYKYYYDKCQKILKTLGH